jgi:TROVE domain-containing protein
MKNLIELKIKKRYKVKGNMKKPLAAQLKKGLALAFTKFDRYQLSKYNKDNPIKLRDVLFLCHAKAKDAQQEQDWKDLINGTLESPDTWEVRLSSGSDKKESFQELLSKGKMGKLAILRNMRNMYESGVDQNLVASELMKNSHPILPFQFLAAAKACPKWEQIIDAAMIASAQSKEKLKGLTVILVDVSASMDYALSTKSEMKRIEAACGLAILLKEVSENYDMFTFSEQIKSIPPRSGMALRDAIVTSQPHRSTYLGAALTLINLQKKQGLMIDRIIVITDEQANDVPPTMKDTNNCYIINVGTYQNGIFNDGQWHTITGFSEHVVDYIIELEKEEYRMV